MEQCEAQVYRRDTYRVDSRAKSGFSMHYERCRCARKATDGGLCAQHAKMAADGRHVLTFEKATP